jgi:hypothetical protein
VIRTLPGGRLRERKVLLEEVKHAIRAFGDRQSEAQRFEDITAWPTLMVFSPEELMILREGLEYLDHEPLAEPLKWDFDARIEQFADHWSTAESEGR